MYPGPVPIQGFLLCRLHRGPAFSSPAQPLLPSLCSSTRLGVRVRTCKMSFDFGDTGFGVIQSHFPCRKFKSSEKEPRFSVLRRTSEVTVRFASTARGPRRPPGALVHLLSCEHSELSAFSFHPSLAERREPSTPTSGPERRCLGR